MQKALALFLLILSTPIWPFLYTAVKLDSPGPFIFKQKRAGKNRKPFTIYKVRTMVKDAEKLKKKYIKLNEADGPLFKIKNDPRHTKVGRVINHMFLDELPQFFNVIKGDMALVGPRPLPLDEAKRVPKKYIERFSVLPGITSAWVTNGYHSLSSFERLELDLEYVKRKSIKSDSNILIKTLKFLLEKMLTSY
jgi:lipopolysaccharide/colanic/teichoic acid biosynthesis glycosyltransferase